MPGLPKELRKGHVVPSLSHSSLVSIKRLCRGGCEVIFKVNKCEVWYQNKKVLTGRTIGPGELWILPIDGREALKMKRRKRCKIHQALQMQLCTLYRTNNKRLNTCTKPFFSMPAPTLEKVITNKQLLGFPCMTIEDIRRHLPPSPTTPKGRMKKPKVGLEVQERTVSSSLKK